MFWTLVQKELKTIIMSPKFTAIFATSTLLILLSVFIGINEYNSNVEQYNTAQELAKQSMSDAKSWGGLSTTLHRKPSPLQIFVSGTNFDVGRFSRVSNYSEVSLRNSYYTDDPIYAIFRHLDFTFIIMIVLSLFAILFSYNAVNGEKEEGTLRLIFSNSLSRAQYILAKLFGTIAALIIPIMIPILISILLLMVYNIPMNSTEWASFFTYLAGSLMYFILFVCIGIFVSATTKKSSASFLILLVFWISFVFIIPRVGVMAAGQIVDIPSPGEIASLKDSFSEQAWSDQNKIGSQKWADRDAAMEGMTPAEKDEYRQAHMKEWQDEMQNEHKIVNDKIAQYNEKVNEQQRNKKAELELLALRLSRFSPASSYMLTSMNLMTTDVNLKNRYEDAMKEYKKSFLAFTEKKKKETGNTGMFQISISSDNGVKIGDGRSKAALDVSEVPKFVDPKINYASVLNSVMLDMGLIVFYSLVIFFVTFIRFKKFDLR